MIFTVELDLTGTPPIDEVQLYLDAEGLRFLANELRRLKSAGRYVWRAPPLGFTAITSGTRPARSLTVSYVDGSEAGTGPQPEEEYRDPVISVELPETPDHLVHDVELHLDDEGIDSLRIHMSRFKEAGDHAHFFGEGWGGSDLTLRPHGSGTRTINHLRVTYAEGLSDAQREQWRRGHQTPLTDLADPPEARRPLAKQRRWGRSPG